MAVTHTNKELSTSSIECGGTFDVTLSVTAEPEVAANPTDIALILDRSNSMAGRALASLKVGAKRFIDMIDEASDGKDNGRIGGGSKIGLVSFATTATQDVPLSTSVSRLKNAVDALDAGGSTNHSEAFTKGWRLFNRGSSNARVMVMFTDGKTTVGGSADAITTAAKRQGAKIYLIGLCGSGGLDESAMRRWASEPSSRYVRIAPSAGDLEDLFEEVARDITTTGATNIVIEDTLNPCFNIVSVGDPTDGDADRIDDTTVQWTIDELGVEGSETASLEFTVKHVGDCTGTVEVNESLTYSDDENNDTDFPSPTIQVNCDNDHDCGHDCRDNCAETVEFIITGCGGTVTVDAGELDLTSGGHILDMNVVLRNVCPRRRVALAAMLSEVDGCGREHDRGMKVLTVPAHRGPTCRDVTVNCLQFVLPRDLDISTPAGIICPRRQLRVRFLANYIDFTSNGCEHDRDCDENRGCGRCGSHG